MLARLIPSTRKRAPVVLNRFSVAAQRRFFTRSTTMFQPSFFLRSRHARFSSSPRRVFSSPAMFRTLRSPKTLIPATLLLGGAASTYYYFYSMTQDFKAEPELEVIPLPMPRPDDFVHPYDNEPYYRQCLYRFMRLFYLSWVFAPMISVGIAALVTKNASLREWWLELLVSTIETAGCTFQKFGQWLSMRPDMFPQDVIEALSKLRSEAPSHSMEHTRKEIVSSFGKELEEIFESFEEEPVASGTMAQVHQARLRPEFALEGGIQDVAVKVRHPNVIWETFADLDLVFQFVENSVNLVHMAFPYKQEEFRNLMQQQIDFKWEAYNLCKFERLFDGEELIKFPKVSLDFLSPSILMESWMDGTPVANMLESFGDKYKEQAMQCKKNFDTLVAGKKQKLARAVHDMSMKMFLRDNFMHGDLHGGNVLMCDDGSLTVLDTGIITSILPDYAPQFGEFLKCLVLGNGEGICQCLLSFHEGAVPSSEKEEEFRIAMLGTTKKFISSPGVNPDGGMVDLGDFIGEMMFNLSKHNINLRSDIAASIQSMSISEGLIRMLDPDYDVCKSSIPYFIRYGFN